MQVPAQTLEIIARSTFRIAAEPYVYLRAGSVGDAHRHLVVARDDRETTVVTLERNLAGVEVLERNPDRWSLVTIDCANPFYCVGFLASIAARFTEAGIDILLLSTFTRDLLLVQAARTEEARRLLLEIGFREA